ncbi:MAG: hypothetical protein AB4911_20915 [Oscillochloridaceae bacterium umkhey_bin13]
MNRRLFALSLLFSLLVGVYAASAAPKPSATGHTTYLPLVVRGGQLGNEPEPPPPPPPVTGALLLGDKSYRSASMAVDGQGGMHAIFVRVAPFDTSGEPVPVYYAYCPPTDLAACAQRSAWRLTELEPQGYTHAQLQFTPAGQPRLLLMGWVADPGGGLTNGHLYRYGECDTQCDTTSNWRFTTVLSSNSSGGLYETDYSYRNFALDHQGRPRFVYQDRADRTDAQWKGAWYAYCDANCANHSAEAPTWFITRIDNPEAGYVLYLDEQTVLRFTSDGRPCVLAGSATVQYVECNVDCNDGANWSQAAELIATGAGASVRSWSLALDGQGRPRATIYPRGGPLYYVWCNDACTNSENWEGYELAAGQGSGSYAALALDAQGRPRLVYTDGVANLGYAWCDNACERANHQWRFTQAEDSNVILRELNVPILPECVRGGWFSGKRPTLVLDAQGHPRIGYDAEFRMECKRFPDDPNSTLTFVETKWWTSRFAFFPQP